MKFTNIKSSYYTSTNFKPNLLDVYFKDYESLSKLPLPALIAIYKYIEVEKGK